jgi:hypothetical protein
MFSRILKPVAVAVSLTLAASAPAFAQQTPAASKPAPAGASAATGAAVGGVSTGAVVAAIAVVAIAAAASSGSSGAAAPLDAANQTASQGATSANSALQAAATAAAAALNALPGGATPEITAVFNQLTEASEARARAFAALSAAFNLPLVGSCAAVTSCTAKEVETLYRNFVIALENEANALAAFQRALVARHDVLRLSSGSTGTLVRAIDDLTSKFEAAKAEAQLAAAGYKKWLAGRAGLTEFAFSGVTGTVGAVGTTGTIFGL